MSAAPRAILPAVNAWNPEFLEGEYARYRSDPASVSSDIRAFFMGFELAGNAPGGVGPSVGPTSDGDALKFQWSVDNLVTAYRRIGHTAAKIDPFGREPVRPASLDPSSHGLSASDLDRRVDGAIAGLDGQVTVRELVAHLERTYCGHIALEFTSISDAAEREWFLQRFERASSRRVATRDERLSTLEQLVRADSFEKFIGKRYPGEKRFSLEGGESTIVLLNTIIDDASRNGVEEVVLGMSHRGRLNVLNNVMGKTYEQIFTEFEDNWEANFADGGGDVKYHRGYSGERRFTDGRAIHLALASNPSHLESVGPVVLGRTRAKQRLRGDTERRRVMPVLVHGDAAIAGQGIVAETFNLSQLEGYTAGGCIHVVINNLIGFTTLPEDARSNRYCTDVAKMVEAPIFHVNGEDPEAMLEVGRLAVEYRQQFRKDVVIDVVCYRRYGHNEQDEQSFTQPLLAATIKDMRGVRASYADRLASDGAVSTEEARQIEARLEAALDAAQDKAKKNPCDPTIDPAGARWRGITDVYSFEPVQTGVSRDRIAEVCQAMGRVPDGFTINPKLVGLLKSRAELITAPGSPVTYADGEMLAFGSLLLDAVPVRLSGQDSRRGTFTQRHSVLRDFRTGVPHTAINHMREMGEPGTEREAGTPGSEGKARQAKFCVYDSPLSEVSVMGFDYGYSLADPNMLVCWEAQFGDFVNGAQVIIDQYLASSELKWDRWSGLVLMLPHGYEGAGPEHSSARMERFLQSCADDNMEVVYPGSASQIFHVLRRQVRRGFRKPLILMTPKSMLRDPRYGASIDDLVSGRFHEVVADPMFAAGVPNSDASKVTRVILCAGKIHVELSERRALLERHDVAIVRVEQLYPLHVDALRQNLSRFPKSAEVVWVQEEPRNMGAYLHMVDQVRTALGIELPYIGRDPSASPAVGSKHAHKKQQEAIVSAAVGPLAAGKDKSAKKSMAAA